MNRRRFNLHIHHNLEIALLRPSRSRGRTGISTAFSGNATSHFNPNEQRDERGRWTSGGSSWRNTPLRNPSAVGRAHTLLGHALAGVCHQGLIREFKLPTDTEAQRFSLALAAWNAASNLNDERFRDRFTRGLVDDIATVRRLRHSWGGDTAATVVAHGAKVGALITIDPVSHFPPDLGDVKANTKNWININANPNQAKKEGEGNGPGNLIAGLGGAWNDDPKDYATHHYNANINHGGVREILPP